MKRLKKQNEYRWDLIPNASGPAGLFLTLSHNLEGSDQGTDRTNPYSKGTDPPCSSAPSYWHSLGTRGAGDLLVLSSSHGWAHLSQLCASVAPWCWWHPTNRHVPCHGRQTLVWFIPVKTRNNYGNETPPFQHKTALLQAPLSSLLHKYYPHVSLSILWWGGAAPFLRSVIPVNWSRGKCDVVSTSWAIWHSKLLGLILWTLITYISYLTLNK